MKFKDFQTLSLFMILAALTILFVMGSRAVLYAPVTSEQKASIQNLQVPAKVQKLLEPQEAHR